MVDLGNNNSFQEKPLSNQAQRSSLTAIENTFDEQLRDTFAAEPISKDAAPFAKEFLLKNYPEMMSAYLDLTTDLEQRGCVLVEQFYKRQNRQAPLIVLEVHEAATNSFLIPNINLYLEAPYDNLRDQGRTSQKQVAALPGEANEFSEDVHGKYQLERYSADAKQRLVFFPASESGIEMPEYRATVPLLMRVQMSVAAEHEALSNAEERLCRGGKDYSYLFDDLLLPALRTDINSESNGFAGIRQEPEIYAEESSRSDRNFSVLAVVPRVESSSSTRFEYGITNLEGSFLGVIATSSYSRS
jgi:hypothetical protein